MASTPTVTNIAQQIEQSADYYPPATYTGTGGFGYGAVASRLSTYNQWTFNTDALADQYIPISTVPQRGRNPKIFAIGVIPPAADVTGRVLDRSASINSVTPINPAYEATQVQTPAGTVNIVNHTASQAPKSLVPNTITKTNAQQVRDAFYQGFVRVTGQPPTDAVLALMMAQSAHETGSWGAIHNYNFGNIKSTAGWPHATTTFDCYEVQNGTKVNLKAGEPGAFFRAYEDPAAGAADYIITLLSDNRRRKPPDAWKQALLTGDPAAFSEILSHPPPYYTGNKQQYTAAMTRYFNQFMNLTSVTPDGYDGKWKDKGSDNATSAREMQDKTANTPLTDVVLELFTAAQKAQILEMSNAIVAMQNVPPLRMMVNPSSLSMKGEKIVADSAWSRNGGTIIEHWGNNQEKLSASGKLAGFYAIDFLNAVGPGLTRTARNFSQSWQNFQSMVSFYANNGGIFLQDPTTNNTDRNLSILGSIYIYYDGILYIGSFDSLSVNESDTAPHTADYSFEFTVRAAFLLDNPVNDPNNYGVATPSNAAQNQTAPTPSGR